MFKNIAAMQRTGVIATVELYEKDSEYREDYFFLTKKGELREPTPKGNRTMTPQKAELLTGKNGLGWLHELHKEQQGNKNLDRTFGEYDVCICQDCYIYCEDGVEEDYDEYQVTDLDMNIAEELHFKQLDN